MPELQLFLRRADYLNSKFFHIRLLPLRVPCGVPTLPTIKLPKGFFSVQLFYDPQVARFASEMATRESQIRTFLIQAQSDLNYALILKNQRNFLRAHSLFKNGNKTSCF